MSTAPILLVDDDDDVRESLSMLLELEGWAMVGVRDGLEALDWLRDHDAPALLLLDLRMPRMSGAELVRALRARGAWAAIPIVVLSGDAACWEVARSFGISTCLVKPFDLDQLLAAVRQAVAPVQPAAPAG